VPAGSVAVPGLEFRVVDQIVELVEAAALVLGGPAGLRWPAGTLAVA
jgi:hypothetical protein